MKMVRALSFLCMAAALPAAAQAPAFDNSGNALLNGSYYFREVLYQVGTDSTADLSDAIANYGQISFNGNGTYTITGATSLDGASGNATTLTTTGTYSISASGYGFITSPNFNSKALVYGTVSNGIFIGSMTETGVYNDLFIAAQLSSPAATTGSFRGTYQMNSFLVPDGTAADMEDATFTLNPDGNGNLGTVNISGYYGAGSSTVITQSSANLKYIASGGAFKATFPTSATANFYSGDVFLYMSADTNFVFGGSPNGFDMIVGVKTSNTTQNFSGLYYEAGLDYDVSQGFGNIDTFYGSFGATGNNIAGHERLFFGANGFVEGFTYSDSYPANITGSYTSVSGATKYTVSNNGAIRIGYGVGPYMGISVGLQAPPVSPSIAPSGVFLNPQGITNAASFAPFTAGVSPGEFIVLYGNNLASGTVIASSLPFPQTLGNVQVLINGIPAPIYYVSPTQISVIVPYGIAYLVARIQVINANVASNAVTEFAYTTTPGLFTLSSNGLGYGAIVHLNGSVVNGSNPAQPGETLSMFLTGLGAVIPPVTEGNAGPTSPLSFTVNSISVYVGGVQSCVQNATTNPCPYVGLAPSLAGLYQINFTVPASATAGDNAIDISGPDSYSSEALIPIGSGGLLSSARPAAATPAVSARASIGGATAPARIRKPARTAAPSGVSEQPRQAPSCFITAPLCASASHSH